MAVFHWLADRAIKGQWSLRFAGFVRWLTVVTFLGAAVWFAIQLGRTAYIDAVLSRHGVAVTATVEDTVHDDVSTQYLLSFTTDGQYELRWETGLPTLKVGQTVAMLVDRRDHARMESAVAYDRRWVLFGLWAFAVVVCIALGVKFMRMDAAGYLSFSLARFGRSGLRE